MTRRYVVLIDSLSRLCGVVSALLLTFAMVIVCQMIFLRYFFRESTVWQTEAVVFSATAAIFLGAPYVLLKKGHVGVDVLQTVVTSATRRRLEQIGSILGFLFCFIMLVATGIHLQEALEGGWTTPSVAAVPLWIPLAPMCTGFFLLCLQYISEILKLSGVRV